ncbi:MAG: hypothetical protein MJB14_19425 [Spirochaetes bacterium]|nr:hypothetical protein [Spirochaetota bacterium]
MNNKMIKSLIKIMNKKRIIYLLCMVLFTHNSFGNSKSNNQKVHYDSPVFQLIKNQDNTINTNNSIIHYKKQNRSLYAGYRTLKKTGFGIVMAGLALGTTGVFLYLASYIIIIRSGFTVKTFLANVLFHGTSELTYQRRGDGGLLTFSLFLSGLCSIGIGLLLIFTGLPVLIIGAVLNHKNKRRAVAPFIKSDDKQNSIRAGFAIPI